MHRIHKSPSAVISCILAAAPCLLPLAGCSARRHVAAPLLSGVKYRIVDLGAYTYVRCINNSGEVLTETYLDAATNRQAPRPVRIWRSGRTRYAPTMRGWLHTDASSINDHGDVVITVSNNTNFDYWDEDHRHSFVWHSSLDTSSKHRALSALPPLPHEPYTSGNAIDNRGDVVGYVDNGGPDPSVNYFLHAHVAVEWRGNRAYRLLTLGGKYAEPKAINQVGVICGRSRIAVDTPEEHACEWVSGKAVDLGKSAGLADGDRLDYATAINLAGEIVCSGLYGYLYTGGEMLPLGVVGGRQSDQIGDVGSKADGINDSGAVVGDSQYAFGEMDSHAFIWRRGRMADLNTLIEPNTGWQLQEANAINNAGFIAGGGKLHGIDHGYVLIPRQSPP